ncbi:MAG: hypothetical protein ACR2PW_05765 [Gammaproteobacteria bacterium]
MLQIHFSSSKRIALLWSILFAIGALYLPVPSGANSKANSALKSSLRILFQQLDTNRDGRFSRAEYAAPAVRLFHVLDTNHNNRLRNQEFAQLQQAARNIRLLHQADTNRDQQVSRSEFMVWINQSARHGVVRQAHFRRLYSRLFPLFGDVHDPNYSESARGSRQEGIFGLADINSDGQLDEEELYRVAQVNKRYLFQHLDVDGNQKLSEQEFVRTTQQAFERFDTNADGQISAGELRQIMETEFKQTVRKKSRRSNRRHR